MKEKIKETESFEDFMQKTIPFWKKLRWDIEMYRYMFLNWLTFGWYHENWERVKYLFIIKLFGFKTIAYVSPEYMIEHTFVFETEEEAYKAWQKLENRGENKRILVDGWWYGKEDFLKEVKKREEYMRNTFEKLKDYKIEIKWLKK